MAQTMKDRRHEREGEDRYLRHEAMGRREAMSMRSHGDDKRYDLGKRSAGEGRYVEKDRVYENEVEEPVLPPEGYADSGLGMHDFKGEADPIAYGQASEEGCREDMKRMSTQFKDYHWD